MKRKAKIDKKKNAIETRTHDLHTDITASIFAHVIINPTQFQLVFVFLHVNKVVHSVIYDDSAAGNVRETWIGVRNFVFF